MKIIVFAHQKGGVGKSTLSLNVAYALIEKGYQVAVQDKDRQGTVSACAQSVEVFTYEQEIDTGKYDYLIIDTPPYLTADYYHLFSKADIVVIPTHASIPDVLEVEKTVNFFKQVQFKNPKVKGAVLYSTIDSRNSMVSQVQEQLESFGLPILKTMIESRVTYQRSMLEEKGVFSDTDLKAQNEIMELADEILNLI